ncbi:MAG TPA: amidohydrolase family protein [Candidatus Binatia bacterium]|nr:amidohydrolase family protein [Candidatus Binatia bacterium]
MQGIIDADTHISEGEAMCALMDKAIQPRRPLMLSVPEDTVFGNRNAFWLIDGEIYPKAGGRGSFALVTPSAQKAQEGRKDSTPETREMTDIPGRLRDMDKLNTAAQVVYPTLFLVYNTKDRELEVALCRAYNRFLARASDQAPDRIKWVAVLPFQSMKDAVDEIRFAKQHGAVGIFFRGIEGEYTLDHPYLFPVYEEAQKQNLSICVHTGCGVRAILEMFDISRNHTFGHTRVMPLLAFRDIIANKIPERFPTLRFGFIEAAAGWVPFLVHIVRRLQKEKFRFASSAELFKEYRLFVACEADEDIPYLAKYTGDDRLLIGSDYPHSDPSREDQFVNAINVREDIPPPLKQKILYDNARAFYAMK